MPDNVQSQRIIPQGGLNTLNNYLTLSLENPGAATKLQNFESSLSGGYRRINGFRIFDSDFASPDGEGKILGVWNFYNTATGNYETMAARKVTSTDAYKFFLYDSSTGWGEISTGLTHDMTHATNGNTVNRIRAEVYNHGTGNQMIFVDGVNPACVFDGTTWYFLLSTNTGGSGSPGGDQIVDAPSIVTHFKNHIFLSGDVDYPAIVCHSAPTDSLTWTVAAGAGQLTIGFDVVQIKPFRDENFIFGSTHIKKALPDPASGFITQDVTNDLGCVARDSVIEIGGNLLFISHDGIRPIAGTDKFNDVELGILSQDIQNIIDDLTSTQDLIELCSVTIRNKTQFRYFFSSSAVDVENAVGIIGCVRLRSQAGAVSQNKWEFGTLLGIRANCTWSSLQNGDEVILHGDYDGVVYEQEVGNNFNEKDIVAIYTTPHIDMGDTTIRKTMNTLQTFCKTEGPVDINVALKFDWGNYNAINPNAYTGSLGSGFAYDDPDYTYDDADALYSGETNDIFRIPIQGSCYSVQYSFSTIDQSNPYTIHGFVHEFTVRGRQ